MGFCLKSLKLKFCSNENPKMKQTVNKSKTDFVHFFHCPSGEKYKVNEKHKQGRVNWNLKNVIRVNNL